MDLDYAGIPLDQIGQIVAMIRTENRPNHPDHRHIDWMILDIFQILFCVIFLYLIFVHIRGILNNNVLAHDLWHCCFVDYSICPISFKNGKLLACEWLESYKQILKSVPYGNRPWP